MCCCCSNNTISTSSLPLLAKHQDNVAAVAVQHPQRQVSDSHATPTDRLEYFSLLTGNRHRRCLSRSSTRNECSHCEQHCHQLTAGPFITYRERVMIRKRHGCLEQFYTVSRFWCSPILLHEETTDSAKETSIRFCYKMLV